MYKYSDPDLLLSSKEFIAKYKVDLKNGLSENQQEEYLKHYGPNELPEEPGETILEKIIEQFKDSLVQILLLAAVISFVIGYFEEKHEEYSMPIWVEPSVIFAILIINGCIAIYQDMDADKAIDALKKYQTPVCLVLRNGKYQHLASPDLVPMDVIELKQGDMIPADIRMVQLNSISFVVDEKILTGENYKYKEDEAIKSRQNYDIQSKSNILFSGTLVNKGNCVGVVIGTGSNTEIGKIAANIQEQEDEKSPLTVKLDEFSADLAKYITYICIAVWLLNVNNFSDPAFGGWFKGAISYFKVAVALAVAAIPEGLPAVIQTCLALGSRRLSKNNALVRKLKSVETLGCTTVICSDKTGTLTTSDMCVQKMFVINSDKLEEFEVEGNDYSTNGLVKVDGKDLKSKGKFGANLVNTINCLSLNNESKVIFNEEKNTISGLPTEAALKVLVEKLGYQDSSFKANPPNENTVNQYNNQIQNKFKKIITLEFSRDRKAMSVLCQNEQKQNILFVKGAPEYMINKSKSIMNKDGSVVNLSNDIKKSILTQNTKLAEQGLRTLAICVKLETEILSDFNNQKTHKAYQLLKDVNNYKTFENDLIILAIIGLRDPPRSDVADSIRKCRAAGIHVIMTTGDIKETAQSIAKEVGIVHNFKDNVFVSQEYVKKSKRARQDILEKMIANNTGMVISRSEPSHKQELIEDLSNLKQICAMTGDGVNDAPALKKAHIGIAMGITGSEVAKNASDMILADDKFSTIVIAVEEGRAIYANMKAFIRYMISSNIGEVVSIFISVLLGFPDGFNSIQLLWVNLVTDGPPATALSFNPPDPDVMKKPPRQSDEPLITKNVFLRYLVIGLYVGVATTFVFGYWYLGYDWSGDGHQLVSFQELKNWSECPDWKDFTVSNFGKYDFSQDPCQYFIYGRQKASTMSLTVLVLIEMLNALNAISDEQSILTTGILVNPYLILAIIMSCSLHLVIMYVSFFERFFGTVPLNTNDWIVVWCAAFPVIIIEEIMKIFARRRTAREIEQRTIKKDQ